MNLSAQPGRGEHVEIMWKPYGGRFQVNEAIDQDPHLPPRGSDAFLPCRAAVVAPDPGLHRRDHPSPPQADRIVLAQAQPRPAGPAGAGLPAQRRNALPRPEQARLPERGQPRTPPLRAPGERANAQLKSWHILRNLRCCPWRAGQLAKPSTSLRPAKSEDKKGSVNDKIVTIG